MILLTEKRINVLNKDVVMMDTENESVYVSIGTYREAAVLFDRFGGELSGIKRMLDIGDVHGEAIDFFYENAPEPLNILAPYLGLVDEDVEVPCDLRVLCGFLHQMSMVIDFSLYISIPVVARKDVAFTKAMLRGWEDSWSELQQRINIAEFDLDKLSLNTITAIVEKVCAPMSEIMAKQVSVYPTQGQAVSYGNEEQSGRESISVNEDDNRNDVNDDPFALFDSLLSQEMEEQEDTEQVKESTTDVYKVDTTANEENEVVEESDDPTAGMTEEEKEKYLTERILASWGGVV